MGLWQHYTRKIHASYKLTKAFLALIQIIFPPLVVPPDLEHAVGVHAEAVGLGPGLQHGLAPDLVLGEGPVAADLPRPRVDQLVVVRVAAGLALQEHAVKQLHLEQVEVSTIIALADKL